MSPERPDINESSSLRKNVCLWNIYWNFTQTSAPTVFWMTHFHFLLLFYVCQAIQLRNFSCLGPDLWIHSDKELENWRWIERGEILNELWLKDGNWVYQVDNLLGRNCWRQTLLYLLSLCRNPHSLMESYKCTFSSMFVNLFALCSWRCTKPRGWLWPHTYDLPVATFTLPYHGMSTEKLRS